MRLLRILLTYLIIALVAAGLLLLNLWPWHPTSWRVWLLFLVLALPVSDRGLQGEILQHGFHKRVNGLRRTILLGILFRSQLI